MYDKSFRKLNKNVVKIKQIKSIIDSLLNSIQKTTKHMRRKITKIIDEVKWKFFNKNNQYFFKCVLTIVLNFYAFCIIIENWCIQLPPLGYKCSLHFD